MITRELALALARRGLPWSPASGDRFYVPDRDLDDEVFVVSGMSVEVSDLPTRTCRPLGRARQRSPHPA